MGLRLSAAVLDCSDPQLVGRFWAALLGAELGGPDDAGDRWIEDPRGGPELIFVTVPEAKAVKNRVHLDLRPDDQATEVERAIGLGARRVDVGQREVSWVVLADPEGNEFCILRAQRAGET